MAASRQYGVAAVGDDPAAVFSVMKDINAHRQKNKKLPMCVDGEFHKCYTKYRQKIIDFADVLDNTRRETVLCNGMSK